MTQTICHAAFLLSALTASMSAFAYTTEWYADHVDEATKTQQACLQHIKTVGQLPPDELDECRRASDGAVRHYQYTPTPTRNWRMVKCHFHPSYS